MKTTMAHNRDGARRHASDPIRRSAIAEWFAGRAFIQSRRSRPTSGGNLLPPMVSKPPATPRPSGRKVPLLALRGAVTDGSSTLPKQADSNEGR